MQRRWSDRYADLTGVVFVVLVIPVFFLGGSQPDPDEKLERVLEFWNSNDGALKAGATLEAISCLFLIWFLGSLRSALRRAEGETGHLSAIAYAGGIVLATTFTVLAMIQYAAADSVGKVGAQVTQTLNVLNSEAHFGVNVGLAVLLLATGIVTLRTGVLFAWLGWSAVVIGIVSATPAALFGLLAFLLWTLLVSILLFRRDDRAGAQSSSGSQGS
jgi:hypothetical protein